jgi:hypothetical protein
MTNSPGANRSRIKGELMVRRLLVGLVATGQVGHFNQRPDGAVNEFFHCH